VKQPAALWKKRARNVEEACRAVRRKTADGIHDLCEALWRVRATAEAFERAGVERGARTLFHELAAPRRLQVDLRLLERVGRLGLLSPDAITALGARWEKVAERAKRRLTRAADGGRMRRLRRRLARLARKSSGTGVKRLTARRHDAEASLAEAPDAADDRGLRRYRRAVRRARILADDFDTLGLPEPAGAVRERSIEKILDRWNDLRRFRRRLSASRREAQRRGTVGVAAELTRLIAALEPAIAETRKAAVAESRQSARVVPIRPAAHARA
jgi:hypothetical protein